MHYCMEPKQQLSDSIRFSQSTLSLELPSTTGNSNEEGKGWEDNF